jgi:hypothetical protein
MGKYQNLIKFNLGLKDYTIGLIKVKKTIDYQNAKHFAIKLYSECGIFQNIISEDIDNDFYYFYGYKNLVNISDNASYEGLNYSIYYV